MSFPVRKLRRAVFSLPTRDTVQYMSLLQDILVFGWYSFIFLVPWLLSEVLTVLTDRLSHRGPVGSEWSLDTASIQWPTSVALGDSLRAFSDMSPLHGAMSMPEWPFEPWSPFFLFQRTLCLPSLHLSGGKVAVLVMLCSLV